MKALVLALTLALFGAGAAGASVPARIDHYADLHGIPRQLAHAVVRVESNFNPRVTGRAGEIGLTQIMLPTARGLGYQGGRTALYAIDTNLYWGLKHLAVAYHRSGRDWRRAASKHNAGLFSTRIQHAYVARVALAMAPMPRARPRSAPQAISNLTSKWLLER